MRARACAASPRSTRSATLTATASESLGESLRTARKTRRGGWGKREMDVGNV